MDMDSYLIERAIVTYISSLVTEKKLEPEIRTHTELANKAFPRKGEKLWRDLRLGQNGGRPRGLTLDLALQLAHAVNIPLPKLLLIAELMIERGWSLDHDIANTERKRKKDDVAVGDTAHTATTVVAAATTATPQ